ncbi:MAG: hypothetical protein GX804_00840 [Lentisphaerae bacterium]|jgi:hypothetical protein|nr:hypothetical protein [Lentisphaerota bacterium]
MANQSNKEAEDSEKTWKAAKSDTQSNMPSNISLSIEVEKLKLQQERIAIERERLEAEREELEIREKFGKDPYDLTFGLTAICVVASICLIFGGIIGFISGLDTGRSQTPQTRKVAVSREFTTMIKSLYKFNYSKPIPQEKPSWIPGKATEPATSLFIMR